MAYMSDHMRSIISEAVAAPHAGAAFLLRSLDPMWQSEIGEPRLWEVELEYDPYGDDWPHYEAERKCVNVECVLAHDAITIAQQDAVEGWCAMRVRPTGAFNAFIDCYDLPDNNEGE